MMGYRVKADLKILSTVSFFVVIAIGILYFTRWVAAEKVASIAVAEALHAERVTSITVSEALQIEVTTNSLELELKDCDVGRFEDTFFLHVYPVEASRAGPEGFINMDFNFKTLSPKSTSTRSGVAYCQYRLWLGPSAVDRIALGQFRSPAGQCCEILWDKKVKFNK